MLKDTGFLKNLPFTNVVPYSSKTSVSPQVLYQTKYNPFVKPQPRLT